MKTQKLSKLIEHEDFINIFCKVVDKCKTKNNIRKATNLKYTDEEYIKAIIFVLQTGIPWTKIDSIKESLGADVKIPGNTLNKKHIWYCDNKIYKKVHKRFVKKSLKICLSDNVFTTEDKIEGIDDTLIKYGIFSTDTSKITNRCGVEGIAKSGFGGHKKCIKVGVITRQINDFVIPVSIDFFSGNTSDSTTVKPLLDKIISHADDKNKNIKPLFLADKGYCSKKVRNLLTKSNYVPIIAHNRRNTKNKKKIIHLPEHQKKVYTKRIVIENFFSWIKNYRRITMYSEKTLHSFEGFMLLASSVVMSNKIFKK